MPKHTSIIVVAYNSRAYLKPCLDSILANMGPDDEVIVVDNASSDGSADLVERDYPQVKLVRNANNGYAGGNNLGAAYARGDYLVFLNPDTVVMSGALAALTAPFAQSSDVGLTTACIVHLREPEIINTCGNTVHYTGLTYCRGAGMPRDSYTISTEVDAVSGAAFAIRRSLFEAIGGFDEQFFLYVEDTDLSWRAQLMDYRCLYVAQAVVQHDYELSYSPTKAFYLDRNRHVMLIKNLERRSYVRLLPGLLLAELVTWGFLLLKGPHYWGVKLKVYRWLWRERAMLRNKRCMVQACRRRRDREFLSQLTYRLEFGQFANRWVALGAALIFHPGFRAAQLLLIGGNS